MATQKTRSTFPDQEEGKAIKLQLQQLASSSSYNTKPTYSANSVLYPDNLIPFTDKHMNYLISHPSLEPNTYLANIKLMTRVLKTK